MPSSKLPAMMPRKRTMKPRLEPMLTAGTIAVRTLSGV